METIHCLQCKNIAQKRFILKQCKTSDWDILTSKCIIFYPSNSISCFAVLPAQKMEHIKMKFFSQIVLDVSAMVPDGLM